MMLVSITVLSSCYAVPIHPEILRVVTNFKCVLGDWMRKAQDCYDKLLPIGKQCDGRQMVRQTVFFMSRSLGYIAPRPQKLQNFNTEIFVATEMFLCTNIYIVLICFLY